MTNRDHPKFSSVLLEPNPRYSALADTEHLVSKFSSTIQNVDGLHIGTVSGDVAGWHDNIHHHLYSHSRRKIQIRLHP